ncbi:MAG: hypothetical protein R2733_24920 [Acidimicrobiales bacterium]
MSTSTPDPAASPADDLTPEQQEQARAMAKELAEARAQILEADPTAIIANHAFGMYELAMLHITNDDPDMKAARLAVDALGALVEGLRGRLDEAESPLNEALHGVRLLFVERTTALKKAAEAAETAGDADSDAGEANEDD